MRLAGRLALSGLALAAGTIAALAQSAVISARSGLIHYVEGQVYVGDQLVESKFGNFPEVKENQTLRTEEGRAEVLLTPGVFLRLGENSSFRMITNRLIDTRLEFLSGSAIVEADDILKDNSTTVVYGDTTAHIIKKGLFRFDSSPAELRVYEGAADVASGDKTVEVKEGHLITLDTLAESRFDKTTTDALNRWSERRAEYVSMANVSAANSLRTSMFNGDYSMYGGGSLYGGGLFASGWYFNPFFGMYTFVPGMDGLWMSPYGYRFWSPFDVYMAYMPGYYYSPYGYGYPGYGYGGYANAYNSVAAKSVPAPSHSSVGSGGLARSSGSASMGHGGVSRGGGFSGISSGTVSAPVSHGGGVGGGVGGGGGHH
jgi:hypothetical protein